MAGGLGKGLDSLIPNIYDENFDSNGSKSLEDILNDDKDSISEIESIVDDITSSEEEDNNEKSIVEDESTEDEDVVEEEDESSLTEEVAEDNSDDTKVEVEVSNVENSSPDLSNTQNVKKNENVAEVLDIVDKNPRITLWSSRSAAVFRYLRKTEPEFSISREASILIDEAVSKKYPHIWELFEGV